MSNSRMANANIKALLSGSRPVTRLVEDESTPELQPLQYQEDPRSLLTDVTGPVIGAVGAVGNLLDLPGSMVRDVLTLNNPFDQLASPFTADNRVSGREMLTSWGLTNPNKETGIGGWLDDPIEGVRDVAGFAAEVALDPLNLLTAPAKGVAAGTKAAAQAGKGAAQGAKAGRGLLNNLTDPLRLSELGEKIGARAAVKRGAQRTGRMLSRTANAIESTRGIGEPFKIVRETSRNVGNELRLAGNALFDSAVSGTRKAFSQASMRYLNRSKWKHDDLVKVKHLGVSRQLDQALRERWGDDFLERVDEATQQVMFTESQAATFGEQLTEPIAEKLRALNFSDEQIDGVLDQVRQVTGDTETLGQQAVGLESVMKAAEETHLRNAADTIPDTAASERFARWQETGNRPQKEMYTELGWEQGPGGDIRNDAIGVTIGRINETGGWRLFLDGEREALGSFVKKSDAMAAAHRYGREQASETAMTDFDDIDDFLVGFNEHDRRVNEFLKSNQVARSDVPTEMQIRNEVRAAQEGVSADRYTYRWLATPEMREIAEQLRPAADQVEDLQNRGFRVGKFSDDAIDYYGARREGEDVQAAYRDARGDGADSLTGGPKQVLNAASPSATPRTDAWENWYTGTGGVNRFLTDPELVEVMQKVRDDYASGKLKGKVTPKRVDRLRKTLANVSEEMVAEFDQLVQNGLIDLKKLNTEIPKIAERIAQEAGGATKKWVVGGQGRQSHVFDSLLSADQEGDFIAKKFLRTSTEGELSEGLEAISYDAARRTIDTTSYPHIASETGQSAQRAKAMKVIEEAEKNGTPLFARRNDDGSFSNIYSPKTVDRVQDRLLDQLKNLGKTLSESATLSVDEMAELQRSQISDFIRRKYGEEIIDEMPRRVGEFNKRAALDFRDGRTGNELQLTEDTYSRLVQDDMVTSDRQEAKELGKVFEIVDSRIDDAIVPKLVTPDGIFNAARRNGLFTNDPVVDAIQGAINLNDTKLRADVFESFVDEQIRIGRAYDPTLDPTREVGDFTLERLLENQKTGVDTDRFLKYMATKRNPKLADEKMADALKSEVSRLKRIQIDSETWDDLAKGLDVNKQSLVDMPGLGSVVKFTDAFTRLFKVGVLAWPARITRDFTSAMLRSIESGMLDMTSAGKSTQSLKLGNALATGRFHTGFAELLQTSPGLKQAFQSSPHAKLVGETKMTTDEAVFRYMQDRFFMSQGGAYLQTNMDMADILEDAAKAGSMDSIRRAIPNYEGTPLREAASELGQSIRQDGLSALNPLNIEGIPQYLSRDPKLRGEPRRRSIFVLDRVASVMGQYTDAVTRGTAVIDQMRRGATFDDALKRAKDTLVDYDSRRFSGFEKEYLKRIFPFYSFVSSQVPYVMKELSTNPTGGLGQIVRAQRHAQDEEYVPYQLRDKAAIPLGVDADGNQSYIASLGLMHEDAVAMLNPDLSDILGDMNPLLKAPVELATGSSLFMRGPLGGRELSEMDPSVGRIVQGIGERLGLREETDARPSSPIGATGEHLVANSPLARLVNTTRVLLDDRKSLPERAINLTSGLKTTTVSPESQQSMLRAELDALLKEEGIRPFTRYSLRKGEIENIEEAGNTVLAQKLRAVEKVRAILDKARKDKLKAQKEN